MAWKCSCGILNASINTRCAGVQYYRNILKAEEHLQVSPTSYDSSLYWLSVAKGKEKKLTDNEDKFTRFFNAHTPIAAALSEPDLIDHIQLLEEIVLEGKAHLTAAKQVQRDRGAKKRLGGEWTITPNGPDPMVTDSINKVEQRKKRMTKLDSQSAKLAALGFNQKEIEAMTAGLRKIAVSDTQEEKDKATVRAIANQGLAVPEIKPLATPNADVVDLSTLKFKF